jgi:hypothetical protein
MHRSIPVIITTAAVALPFTTTLAATHPASPPAHAHPTTATPGWLTYNAATQTALITVVAGYDTTNGGGVYAQTPEISVLERSRAAGDRFGVPVVTGKSAPARV